MATMLPALIAILGLAEGQNVEVIAAVVTAVVGFPLFYFLFAQQQKRRSEKIAAALAPLGFTFRAAPTPEDLHVLDGFTFGPLYERGWRKRLHNFAHAPTSEHGALVIFDGEFRVDLVPGEKAFGVVAFQFVGARLSHPEIRPPIFHLTPGDWADRLKPLFPAGPIEFPDDPEFNRLFRLQSRDEAAVRAYFTPELRQALRPFAQRLELEGREGHLLHYHTLLLSPSKFPQFVETTRRLAQLFRRPA